MTDKTAIVNRALAALGTRTTVTAAELAAASSNEAIQVNLIYEPYRNQLLRMAPWNCAFLTANLTYITSVQGTPENTSSATPLWARGLPAPPWAYEYQYPPDCLRACWVTPQTATGFANGIPITTAITGGAPSFWQGPPVKFRVAIDNFNMIASVVVAAPGTGYAVGDVLTLGLTPNAAGQLQGAPALLAVQTINGSGGVLVASVIPQILGLTSGGGQGPGGSYFYTYNVPQLVASAVSTFGAPSTGVGATFTPTYTISDQRVILTNQEFAILNYVKQVLTESVFDDDFQEAFVKVLGAGLVKALTGDKSLANLMIAEANAKVVAARGTDGNEGLTVNDVLPDWLRVRGINYTEDYSGPYNTGFNWGSLWPGFS